MYIRIREKHTNQEADNTSAWHCARRNVVINFFGRFEQLIRGPHIQGKYKQYFFPRKARDIPVAVKFYDGRDRRSESIYDERKTWNHFLFPSDCMGNMAEARNYSVGPNIPLYSIHGPAHPKFSRRVLRNRWIVADSEWNREALLMCFPEIDATKVVVIPVYIGEHFYTTPMRPRDQYTVGCVGYPDDVFNIKNLDALLSLARLRPQWRFELVVNRNRVPDTYRDIPNLRVFREIKNEDLPEIMRRWSCYLGISKRERGPSTMQEAKAMGCPTICSDHTGYSSFDPLVGLKIPPFVSLSDEHIRHIDDTLQMVADNRQAFLDEARKEKERFWKSRTPEIITRNWKQFFYDRIREESVLSNRNYA